MGARYICRACGLIYDEALGDADSGLAPGTRFADIPDDWACPLCGVTKADFEPYELIDSAATARAASTLARPGRRVSARQHAGTVIVGAGHAGWAMAEALRAHDPELPITVVTACDGSVYDKPMISVALARGLAPESMHRESGPSAAARLGVTLLTRTHAIGITRNSRQLRTSRGTLRYRDLVLAHGAQSRLPAPLSAAHCWRINHLSVYVKFRAAVGTSPQRIAVIGAGLIGCELANDLALAGHRVTLFDLAARPLAACLDEAQSRQLLQAWSGLALDFVGGVSVQAVERTASRADAHETQITLTDGRLYRVDQVVAAVGLATPGRLAASAGLAFDNGIVVEQGSLATSVPHIHAIGDCISIAGKASRYIEPIGRQARLVAARIAGVSAAPYAGSPVPIRIKTTSLSFTVAGS